MTIDTHPAVDELRELRKGTDVPPSDDELERITSYTLADAIREGSSVTEQLHGGFEADGKVCALTAAVIAAKSRDYL